MPDENIPPAALRQVAVLIAMHSLIQVAGAQEPEKIAEAAVALADATLAAMAGPAPVPTV